MLHRSLPLAAALLVMLAGCSQTDDSTAEEVTTVTVAETTTTEDAATATTEGTTTTAATTSTTGLAASVSYGPAVLVEGLEECELNPPIASGITTYGDGTVHTRDAEFECSVSSNDPRIAGTATYTANLDRWTTTGTDGVQVQWGTIRIENEGGAWEADYIGIFSPETGDVGAELYTGTGDYEGLYYYQWVIGTVDPPWPTRGLIFPTTVPLPERPR